jgi:hypothetical protein
VFDRSVDGEVLEFGVSGLLYESNLVMYDRATESLWSQSLGEAIAGEYTGTRLDILLMQVIEFGDVLEDYPDARVLSADTGYTRDYYRNPYAGYEESDQTYFPVEFEDARYFAKELFWVFRLSGGETSVALRQESLGEEEVRRTIDGHDLRALRDGAEIHVSVDGEATPGYVEMWFSWATRHQDDGVVWDPAEE